MRDFFLTHPGNSAPAFIHVTNTQGALKIFTVNFGTEFVDQKIKTKFKTVRPFEIKFDFPVASSDLKISLRATVELHHSEPYYLVRNFQLANNNTNNHSVLPEQEIIRLSKDDSFVWAHKDSKKESELSIAIGTGIENKLSGEEINDQLS